jgi:type IV pilus assembly protein PilE
MRINAGHTLKSKAGITLIELLVVIVVVGILAAVAIPMYTGYMQRARRADAKTALEQLRAAQEMRRAERGGYETNIVALQTTWGAPAATAGDYTITMVATTTTYTGTATPTTSRQSSDGWLSINQDGVKADQAGKVYPDPKCKWSK